MPRGGRRVGAVGKGYANRQDLNPAHKLPIQVAKGQPYGAAKQQHDAQAQIPMASGELGGPDLAGAQQSAQNFQPPPVVPLGAPSMRPNEPVTAPPSQPSAPNGPDPLLNGVALLNSLGDAADPDVKALRSVVSAQQANSGAP